MMIIWMVLHEELVGMEILPQELITIKMSGVGGKVHATVRGQRLSSVNVNVNVSLDAYVDINVKSC